MASCPASISVSASAEKPIRNLRQGEKIAALPARIWHRSCTEFAKPFPLMKTNRNLSARHWGGGGLILLGLLIGAGTYITVIGPIFGLILIAIGIYVIARTARRQAEQSGGGRADAR